MFYKARLLPHVFLICVSVVLTVLALTTSNAAHPVFQAPSNDNFANAQPILGSSGIIHGTNVDATKEQDEPNHAGGTRGSSVWYRWQAPADGRFVFSTFQSNFDTVIAVYTGKPLANNLVASNNDEEGRGCFSQAIRFSKVAFNATGGAFYHIAIDGNSSFGSNGDIVLRWGRSATIRGGFSSASGGIVGGAETIRLEGDTCKEASQFGVLNFPDLLIGGHYTIFVSSPGRFWAPWPGNKSISPLAGDVLDLRFYVSSPTGDVVGHVGLSLAVGLSGVTVTCSSGPPANVTRTVTTNSSGFFNCNSLPILGTYLVTPSSQNFLFSPANASPQLTSSAGVSTPPFTATAARTISGRVTQPNGTIGVSGVSISLSGSQTGSIATDASGNYSFVLPLGGNYTVTPSNANFTFTPANLSFNNLSAPQTANFTASFLLQLILDDLGQVGALDSVLLMRDPFPVINPANLLNRGVDRNTRVAIFLSNFQLGPGELPSSVVINLVGSNSQSYDIPAEDVRPLPDGLTRVTFRLPDTLTAGTCTLLVKARGLTSNMSAMRIK